MKATTAQQAAEMAADFIYHVFYEDLASPEEAVDKAAQIYEYILGEELDFEGVLGDTEENLRNYG